jgi:plasmid stabilization system protein ParE
MAGKTVIWTDDAKSDLYDILEYWDDRNRSKAFSTKLLREFDDAAERIGSYPFHGKEAEVEDVCYIIVRHYAITYHLSENIIHIISVWDERRNPQTRPI